MYIKNGVLNGVYKEYDFFTKEKVKEYIYENGKKTQVNVQYYNLF